jgi:hypothetical protein
MSSRWRRQPQVPTDSVDRPNPGCARRLTVEPAHLELPTIARLGENHLFGTHRPARHTFP